MLNDVEAVRHVVEKSTGMIHVPKCRAESGALTYTACVVQRTLLVRMASSHRDKAGHIQNGACHSRQGGL